MSDTSLFEKRSGNYQCATRQRMDGNSAKKLAYPFTPKHFLDTLPVDVLLIISEFLDVDGVTALSTTCRSLNDFAQSRSIWLKFATRMLDLCRPLPIHGFQRIWEMKTSELAGVVKRGRHIQHCLNSPHPSLEKPLKIIKAPESEEIVWLSPITSKYTLCCTKSGKVMCWNVSQIECVAEWQSSEEWEIWKCRVEFDERVVYFAMAKREPGSDGETDCLLMALTFPAEIDGKLPSRPAFSQLSSFSFPGHVISVYLLDPLQRLLSAYIWLEDAQRLGLFLLLDWANPSYTFIDTGIPFEARQESPREWSCIGYDPQNVVIHGEEKDKCAQYFYPISLLESLKTPTCPPSPRHLVPPVETIDLSFNHNHPEYEQFSSQSAHFVRQWWPTIPHSENIRKQSCTIILLTFVVPNNDDETNIAYDYPAGTHLFTIAQHYFSIPLLPEQLRWWYLRDPFEIVCFPHLPPGAIIAGDEVILPPLAHTANDEPEVPANGIAPAEGGDVEGEQDVHVIPLIAVDFGCAVWLEYVAAGSDEKRLRFVTFPSVDVDRASPEFESVSGPREVRTLDCPDDLDLNRVSHIGIDQAQGAVILGLTDGQVYILRYR